MSDYKGYLKPVSLADARVKRSKKMNNKIFAVTIIYLLWLIAFAGSAPAQTSTTPNSNATEAEQSPVGIIAIGHSGLTGEWSDPNRLGQEAKNNSWATGDAPEVNSIYTLRGRR
jgi:hypothetical protein